MQYNKYVLNFLVFFTLFVIGLIAIHLLGVHSNYQYWIYGYDPLGYHAGTIDMHNNLLNKKLFSIIKMIYKNVFSQEYNILHSILPASVFIFLQKIGLNINEAGNYATALYVAYIFPVYLLVCFLLKKLFKTNNMICFILIYIAFYLLFIHATFYMFPNSLFSIVMFLVALIMYINKPIQNRSITSLSIFGFVIYSIFLVRRPALFTVVSFLLSIGLVSLYELFLEEKNNKKALFIKFLKAYGVIVLIIIFSACVLQYGLIRHIIKTSYVDTYSYYSNGYFNNIYALISNNFYEFIFLTIPIMLIALSFKYNNLKLFRDYSKILFILFFGMILNILMISSVQNPGLQHYDNLVLIYLTLIYLITIYICYKILVQNNYNLVAIALILICLVSVVNHTSHSIKNIVSQDKEKYIRFFNIVSWSVPILIKDNRNYIVYGANIGDNRLDREIYAFLHMLKKIDMPFWFSAIPDIDLRDTLTAHTFLPESLIIVDDVNAVHVDLKKQNVYLSTMNYAVLKNINIGKAYKKVVEKEMYGSKYAIYYKTRLITKQEFQELFNELYKYYPQWQGRYNAEVFYNEQLKYNSTRPANLQLK